MKKKVIIIFIVLFLIIGFGIRLYFVNNNVASASKQIFAKNIEVSFGKDFFERSDINCNGYTVKVVDAWIEPANEFLQKYQGGDPSYSTLNFYLVKVEFVNKTNVNLAETGIDLLPMYLHGTNYLLSFDDVALQQANPKLPGYNFSLENNEPFEVILPYVIHNSYVTLQHVKDDPPKLLISLYPEMKLIALE